MIRRTATQLSAALLACGLDAVPATSRRRWPLTFLNTVGRRQHPCRGPCLQSLETTDRWGCPQLLTVKPSGQESGVEAVSSLGSRLLSDPLDGQPEAVPGPATGRSCTEQVGGPRQRGQDATATFRAVELLRMML